MSRKVSELQSGSESGLYSSDIWWTNTVYRGRALPWERVVSPLVAAPGLFFFPLFKKFCCCPKLPIPP